LEAYRHAAGGDALDGVRALRATGVAIDPAARTNRHMVIEAEAPARYRQRESSTEPSGPQYRTLIGFTGTEGWWAGTTALGGDGQSPDPAIRRQAITAAGRQNYINAIAGMLPLWLLDAGVTMTPLGPIQDGRDRGAAAFTLSIGDTPVGRLLMDPDTHLPRQLVVPYHRHIRRDGGEYTVTFDDYREIDGVRLPHRFMRAPADDSAEPASQALQWIIRAYDLNPTLPKGTFEPPRQR
jgi:hypothetical protein